MYGACVQTGRLRSLRERPVARPVLGVAARWREPEGARSWAAPAGWRGAGHHAGRISSAWPAPLLSEIGVLCFRSKAGGSLDGMCQERSHERCDIEAGIMENIQNV